MHMKSFLIVHTSHSQLAITFISKLSIPSRKFYFGKIDYGSIGELVDTSYLNFNATGMWTRYASVFDNEKTAF